PVKGQVREVVTAEPGRESLAPNFGVGKLVKFTRKTQGLLLGRGDQRAQARQNQGLVYCAPRGRNARLKVGVECLRGGLLHVCGKDCLSVARCKAATGGGGPRLHKHRPALRRARHVERPGYTIVCTLVVYRPDGLRLDVDASCAVVENR